MLWIVLQRSVTGVRDSVLGPRSSCEVSDSGNMIRTLGLGLDEVSSQDVDKGLRTHVCSLTVTPVSCQWLPDIPRLRSIVKEWDPVSLGIERCVKSSSIALCGFAHLQLQYLEIVENKLRRSGATRGFDLEIGAASSGRGCLLLSFIAFASSSSDSRRLLRACGVVGFTTRPINSSSPSVRLLLMHFLNVSRRGNGDDANSCQLYQRATKGCITSTCSLPRR